MLNGANTRFYNPADVRLIIDGVEPTDVADGTMYMVSRNEDVTLPTTGVLGDSAVAINQNRTGALTVSLKQTSPTHLAFITKLGAIRAGGTPLFNIYLEDPSSTTAITTVGTIITQPDWELGKEINQFDWVVWLADSEFELIPGQNEVIDSIGEFTIL